ncbi:MAG: tetratricopeptide repeat protein [Chitinophagales bacterium]|nr:tetratricopeptide repeat protein [Chitinophagales bacterium]
MKQFLLIWLVALYPVASTNAQKLYGQAAIDSMLSELPKAEEDSNKVKLLNVIGFQLYAVDPDKGIKYGDTALALAKELKWEKGIADAYKIIGINYTLKGDYSMALDHYTRAFKQYEAIGDDQGVATVGSNMSQVFDLQGNYPKALEYALDALSIIEKTKTDNSSLGNTLNTVGTIYSNLGNHLKALEYHLRSYKYYVDKDHKTGQANLACNIGIDYMGLGDNKKALEYYTIARKMAEETDDMSVYISTTINVSQLYADQKDYLAALTYVQSALQKSRAFGSKNHIVYCFGILGDIYLGMAIDGGTVSKSMMQPVADLPKADIPQGRAALLAAAITCLQERLALSLEMGDLISTKASYEVLSKAYELKGDFKKSLEAHKQYLVFKDSLFNKENTEKIAKREVQAEYEKKQIADSIQNAEAQKLADVKLQRQRTMTYSGIGVAVLLLAFSVFIFRNNKKLGVEKEKSETLLYNILPEEVAYELKERGATTAQHYDNVTVLFTDFVNFTTAGERMGSQALVEELHNCFKAFDGIMEKYGIEKIKTIGDAYLAVCGLPTADEQHAEKVVHAAKDILQFMLNRRTQLGDKTFEIRIGVHSGEVVAGIVGVKKFAYDIWGDTVNTAARMEQNSTAGHINISQTTYELVQDKFTCTYRGELEAKNKGKLKMYFVEVNTST